MRKADPQRPPLVLGWAPLWFQLACLGALLAFAGPAHAGTFGVPNNLLADGQACIAPNNPAGCTFASTNPPGYFILDTTGTGAAAGDTVHQIRFFIEVTGTTLDIRVFDPDSNNDRDYNGAVNTRYRLYNPAGGQIQTNTIAGASAATNNRLTRFNCNAGWENPNAGPNYFGLAGCTNGAAITPGRYEFRVTVNNDADADQYNAFGIDVRDGSGNPYNVYVEADSTGATDSSMVVGAFNTTTGTGLANITPPMVFYPYVNRGCTTQTSNFDMDSAGPDAANPVQIGSGAYATLTDALGVAAPSLTMSGATVHSESTITVAPTGVTSLDVANYGMYTLVNGPGSQQNIVDWRVADWNGWVDNPANAPRDPTGPIRTFLPNAPCPVGTCPAVTDPPSEPVLTASARVCGPGACTTAGGANPPVVGQNTGFLMLAVLYNPGPAPLTAARVYGGATSVRVTYRGQPKCFLDGTELTGGQCTFTQPAVGTIGPFSVDAQYAPTLATGHWLGFSYEVQLNASGLDNLMGAPGEANTIRATYTAFGGANARTENLGPLCQTPINIGDVSVTNAVAPLSVQPGGLLTYTIAVSSAGNAGSAFWTDSLPAGTLFQSLTNPAPATWVCSTPPAGGTGTVSCSAASLASGTTATFLLTVRVSPAYLAGSLGNTATVASEGDTNLANNSATATATVTAPPTLSVAKSASVSSQVVGTNFQYVLTVANTAAAAATGVVLQDVLPANTSFQAIVAAAGWTCTTPVPGTIRCTPNGPPVGSMAPGSATFTVTVQGLAAGTAVNTATVSSTTPASTSQSLPVTTQIYATAPTAPTCAAPGRDGNLTVTGVLAPDTYYPGTANAAAGATSIVLGAPRGGTAIAVGDLLLVIQMQDAGLSTTNDVDYGAANDTGRGSTALNNAGRYEFVRASSALGLAAGTVNIVGTPLVYAYTNVNAAGGTAPHRFQVIRVPQYSSVTYGSGSTYGTLTALPWNGTTGGVLALDVAGTMTLGADPVLSVQSLTRAAYSNAAAVAVTVTTAVNHNYNVGDLVTIAGADQAPYNGTFPILSRTATTFTYSIVSTWVDQRAGTAEYPPTPGTGTLTATRHPVDVTGRGFRGGGGRTDGSSAGAYTDYRTTYAAGPNGSKAEGTAGTPQILFDALNGAWDPTRITNTGLDSYPNGSMARGAPGNAGGGGTDGVPNGGNSQNSGGGGGGNGGIGGQGGNSWNSNYANGGIGGDTVPAAVDRIVMGGGGGAGSRNNSALSASSGGAGGGIVLIRAGSVAGAGTVAADGAQGIAPENDGGGGGGAGGTIVIAAATGSLSGVTARARGARGTDAWGMRTQPTTNFPDERHGPGGGGGGGWVLTTSAPGSVDVAGGGPGVTSLASDPYGASPGAPGQSATLQLAQIPGVDGGPDCSADLAIVKSAAVVSPTSLVYTLVVTNNGFWSAATPTVTDVIPAGTTFVSVASTMPSCGYAAGTVTCNLPTMVSGASATITIRVTPPASGTLSNTGTASSATPDPVSTNNSSTVSVNLAPPVDLAVTIAAPANPLTAGQTAAYAVTVRNNGPNAAPNAALTIPIPEDATFQSIAAPSGWACVSPPVGSGPPAQIVCTRASAPVDPTGVTFSLGLGIPAGTPSGTVVTLVAAVSTTGYDTNPSNDKAAVDNTVGPPALLLTRATIAGLRVRPAAGLVEFATGMQHGTVSFNVYATRDPGGREGLVALNASPIFSPRLHSTTPILYSLQTDPITAPFLVIEERDVKGRVQKTAALPVASRHMRLAYERIEARLAGDDVLTIGRGTGSESRSLSLRRAVAERRDRRSRTHAAPRRREPRVAREGVRVETSGSGSVAVLRSDLVSAGLPADLPLARLRLTNRGRPVRAEVVGSGPREALRFLAQPLSTLYTGRNVYVATWGRDLPQMRVPLTTPETPVAPGFARIRKNTIYLPTAPLGIDPWFWDAIMGDGVPWPSPEYLTWFPGINEFDLPGLLSVPGDAAVRATFWTDVAGQHDVSVRINGVHVGDLSFAGAGDLVLEGTIAVSALRASGNTVEITYAGSPEAPESTAWVCLRYLEIGAQDPAASVAGVRALEAYDAGLPDLRAVEYLIVTHPDFARQAERIAGLKRAEGFRAAVVSTEQVYDHFSAGITEAESIHGLIRRAASGRRLRHVLLIGADTFDPQDFVGTGAVSFLPSLYGWDGEFGRVASENRYADVDGDGRPDVAIGRLPVETAAEADILADKISRQQETLRAAAPRQVFVVDNDPVFQAEAGRVASGFPAANGLWSDLAGGWTEARQALSSAWGQGVAVTNYFGHGGPEQWADERLADVADAESATGQGGVFLTWTCMAQDYLYLWGPSVNEAFLLNPNGGALASFGPVGLTDVSAQAALYGRVYEELKRPGVTLGEALRRGKARAVAADPRSVPAVEGFNLLGDPALVLPLSESR